MLDHFASLSAAGSAPAAPSRYPARSVQGRTADPDADAWAQIAAMRATAGAR